LGSTGNGEEEAREYYCWQHGQWSADRHHDRRLIRGFNLQRDQAGDLVLGIENDIFVREDHVFGFQVVVIPKLEPFAQYELYALAIRDTS
jgi:hypothetical protein